jgi:hypothetical protein
MNFRLRLDGLAEQEPNDNVLQTTKEMYPDYPNKLITPTPVF